MQGVTDSLDDSRRITYEKWCYDGQDALPSGFDDGKASARSHEFLATEHERRVVRRRNERRYGSRLHSSDLDNYAIYAFAKERENVFALQLRILVPCALESFIPVGSPIA
jgi:hypothetical protein